MGKTISRVFSISAAVGLMAGASADLYQVRPGDTLSGIAAKHLPGRVWGERGSLARLMALNAWIKSPHWIFPHQKIALTREEPKSLAQTPEGDSRAPASGAESRPPLPPTQVESPLQANDFHPYSIFQIMPTFTYARMDSTDLANGGSSSLLSNLNPGFDFSWTQVWNSKWETFVDLGLIHRSFNSPSGKDLTNPDVTATDVSIGVRRHASERLSLSAQVGMGQQLFNRGTASSITFDEVAVPEILASANYTLCHVKPFDIGVFAGGGYLFSSATDTYDIHSGSTAFGGVSLEQSLSDSLNIIAQGFYQSTHQDSTIATQSFRQVGASLGFGWAVGR